MGCNARPVQSTTIKGTLVPFRFEPNGSSDPTTSYCGLNVSSITRTATGTYTVQLNSRHEKLVYGNAKLHRASPAWSDVVYVNGVTDGRSADNSVTITVCVAGAASDVVATSTAFVSGLLFFEEITY